ncbi:MAG: hypothetical protein HY349_07740 [Nitrospirae bacterium]|nr:hypothetical protein [Nitrospirota bacterium]
MGLWVKLILGGLGLVGAGLGLAIGFGSARWNGKTAQFVDKLTQATPRKEARRVTFSDFEQLPSPVANYFRWALKEGQPMIRSVRIVQAGEFRTRKADDGWNPFEATQYFSAQPPGFVWDAGIRMAPLMKVRVRDAYVAGQGTMQAKILSLVSVVDEQGKAELNAGALQRYLAEAVWFPTALLPSESVKWSPIDNSRALATLTDSGTRVSMEFHFSDVGEIIGVFTPGRYREVDGKYELTPWEGHFRHYEEREGMRIPVEGDVEWRLQDGSFPYWKGRIVKVIYDFADDLPPVKKTGGTSHE